MTKYIHYPFTHSKESPIEIVSVLYNAFNPKSVVDVGCGIGNFLFEFKQAGVEQVLGVDGNWVDKETLHQHLTENEFIEVDLEQPLNLNRKFDLALCAEVAEHIDEKYADNLISSLISLSDIIVFSAAIPYQGGQNHVNEQWMDYWIEKFNVYDYQVYDLLRPIFWNNEKVQWWYKQNMFVVAKKGIAFDKDKLLAKKQDAPSKLIHPELYLKTSKTLEDVLGGRMGFAFYTKLLVKKLLKATHLK